MLSPTRIGLLRRRSVYHFRLLLLALPLLCCSGGDVEASAESLPNIILISLDTLRADHLSLYGYSRKTSPQLDEFAKSATVFSRAQTTAPWTLSAHASLFTGLYPPEHGAQMVRPGEGVDPDAKLPLSANATTLAEVLAKRGYDTAAVCGNLMYLVPRYGLDQGFRHFETLKGMGKLEPARGEEINLRARDWLVERNKRGDDAPFFLFLNYMDTHTPYNTAARPGFLEGTPAYSAEARAIREEEVNSAKKKVPPENLAETIDQYDLAIANLDESLGRFFATLRELDLFEDSMIVILSDHGEYLGEHRLLGHAKDVYQGAMHIPLIVKAPRQDTAVRQDGLISIVHIPNLILKSVGFKGDDALEPFPYHWPEKYIQGKMRYSLWVDLKKPWGQRFNRVREALYEGPLKFIHSSDGRHELYNLVKDPGETDNLLIGSHNLVVRWTKHFSKLRLVKRKVLESEAVKHVADDLSEEDRAKLRALGYVE